MKIKINLIIFIALLLLPGCKALRKIGYQQEITQGNYLTEKKVMQLREGLTREQVIYLMDQPILVDPFDANKFFYISRKSRGRKVQQKLIIVQFDDTGKVIWLKNS